MSLVTILTDPFIEDMANMAVKEIGQTSGTQSTVRRPYAGVLHGDEHFAYLSVKSTMNDTGGAPEYISIIDSSTANGTSQHNHNFMLTQVDFSFQEKAQIIQTFGSDYAFFFGQQPVILNCAGFLLNTKDFNWQSEWVHNYQNYLRGTACVRTRSRVYLGFKRHIAVGYLLTTSMSMNASQENVMGFNFTMLLTNFVDYSRHNPRSITDVHDTGYNVVSTVGARDVEYVRGGVKDTPEITYVDFQNFQVTEGKTRFSAEPSIDALNTTWWLPGLNPLESTSAFTELAILQYMEENSVSREEANLAALQGKLISSDPDNLRKIESVFDRTISNEALIV